MKRRAYKKDSKVEKLGNFYKKDTPGFLTSCIKLSNVVKYWDKIVDPIVAQYTKPSAFRIDESNKLIITIHVEEASVLQAIMFRKRAITQKLRKVLKQHDLKVEIKRGKIERLTLAKDPLPPYKRRAPIILDPDEIQETAEEFSKQTGDAELAELFAKIKLSSDKLKSRKK